MRHGLHLHLRRHEAYRRDLALDSAPTPPPGTEFSAADSDRKVYQSGWPIFQDCSIIETLYARPLQFNSSAESSSIIPMSATYAYLVRKLLVIHDMHSFPEVGATELWPHIIRIATQLCKLFPRLKTLRLVVEQYVEIEDTWETICGKGDAARGEQVRIAENLIQTTRWRNGRNIKVPAQLELVHASSLDPIVHEETDAVGRGYEERTQGRGEEAGWVDGEDLRSRLA
jgi:hypothetical protein